MYFLEFSISNKIVSNGFYLKHAHTIIILRDDITEQRGVICCGYNLDLKQVALGVSVTQSPACAGLRRDEAQKD